MYKDCYDSQESAKQSQSVAHHCDIYLDIVASVCCYSLELSKGVQEGLCGGLGFPVHC